MYVFACVPIVSYSSLYKKTTLIQNKKTYYLSDGKLTRELTVRINVLVL